MARSPLVVPNPRFTVESLPQQASRSRKKPAVAPEVPAWLVAVADDNDRLNPQALSFARATPLETIAALLLHDETRCDVGYESNDARFTGVPSGLLMRAAFRALRLEQVPPEKLELARSLKVQLKVLQDKLAEANEALPLEARRGW